MQCICPIHLCPFKYISNRPISSVYFQILSGNSKSNWIAIEALMSLVNAQYFPKILAASVNAKTKSISSVTCYNLLYVKGSAYKNINNLSLILLE